MVQLSWLKMQYSGYMILLMKEQQFIERQISELLLERLPVVMETAAMIWDSLMSDEWITYSWDSDDIGNQGQKVGYVGYSFLESPGNPFDGIDNDDDSRVTLTLQLLFSVILIL